MSLVVDKTAVDREEVDILDDKEEVMNWEEAKNLLDQQAEEARLRAVALDSVGLDLSTSAARVRPATRPATHPATRPATRPATATVSLSAAAAAGAALASASGGAGEGINPRLLQLIVEQQKLLAEAEGRRAPVAPAPQFQILNQPVAGGYKPQPVSSNLGLMLGAQMGQLSLDAGKTLVGVDDLLANQMAMQQHQMGLLRKQQQEAAEAKVVFSARFI